MKKNIVFICFLILMTFLSACSESVKTYPSLDLPYEIVNEEVEELKEEGLEEYLDYQVLEKIEIREITPEENEKFLEKMIGNSLNDLNKEYKAVEFDFGKTNYIHKNKKVIGKLDEKSYFVYDDEILNNEFYQIRSYENNRYLKKNSKNNKDEKEIYGEIFEDLKIITIVDKNYIKKGLQFKTIINDEIIYIDIK